MKAKGGKRKQGGTANPRGGRHGPPPGPPTFPYNCRLTEDQVDWLVSNYGHVQHGVRTLIEGAMARALFQNVEAAQDARQAKRRQREEGTR